MSWQPTGLNVVGVCDFEYDEGQPQISPQSHLVGKFFYPANPKNFVNYPTVLWLPNFAYIHAITKFLFVSTNFLIRNVLGRLLSNFVNLLRSNFKLRGRRAPPLIFFDTGEEYKSDIENGYLEEIEKINLPIIIFSHGLGGNRTSYSFFCSEMASHGFFVLAIEHADTSASMVQLAGKRGRIYFDGYGNTEKINDRIRYRVGEMSTAIKIVKLLNDGFDGDKLKLKSVENEGMFKGRLDLDKVAAVGHSYGGATVAEAMATYKNIKLCVSLDPYFPSLPADSKVLNGWENSAPIIIIGSQEFNTPNEAGNISAGKQQQQKIISLAQQKDGIVFGIPKGSIHQNFDDASVILQDAKFTRNLLQILGFKFELDPFLALKIVFDCSRAFIEQRFNQGNSQVSEQELEIYQKIMGDNIFKLKVFAN
eukprot:TRINITY_DN29989_c1_g4_i1.p1 TRINITY_DN29989_c1_g4~~TRINITY_DN29989_c1_g4_i1.p1  ORF type:complete len:422 (-),score=42.48 TRINITY_DN29989_c1_g4_i1:177-1442(-)